MPKCRRDTSHVIILYYIVVSTVFLPLPLCSVCSCSNSLCFIFPLSAFSFICCCCCRRRCHCRRPYNNIYYISLSLYIYFCVDERKHTLAHTLNMDPIYRDEKRAQECVNGKKRPIRITQEKKHIFNIDVLLLGFELKHTKEIGLRGI